MSRPPRPSRGIICLALALLALWPARAAASTPKPPEIPAREWLLIDAGDHKRLAAHDPDDSRAMASTTKLMTAYLSLRELPLKKELTAPAYHPIPGESLLGLEPGERMTVRDLLYGLLLPSGNDAAVTLADGAAGSTEAFVDQMNKAARRLGLDDTNYANPIGLDAPNNYSSARDLANLALTLRHNALFRRIVNTPRITLHSGEHPRTIENHNDLVITHPWINGVKTGYTPDAGNVLVASGTQKGATLLSVVMGAPSIPVRDSDTLKLLDYGFSLYSRQQAVRSGQRLASARVPNADTKVPLEAKGDLSATVRRGQKIDVTVHAPKSVKAPIHRGEKIGVARATLVGDPVGSVPLVAGRGVKPTPPSSPIADVDEVLPGPRIVVWIICIGLVAIVILIGTALVRRSSG